MRSDGWRGDRVRSGLPGVAYLLLDPTSRMAAPIASNRAAIIGRQVQVYDTARDRDRYCT